MGGLLHLVQRGGPGRAGAPSSPLLVVPNVTDHPSTASVPTSYYSMWHYNCILNSKGLKKLYSAQQQRPQLLTITVGAKLPSYFCSLPSLPSLLPLPPFSISYRFFSSFPFSSPDARAPSPKRVWGSAVTLPAGPAGA